MHLHSTRISLFACSLECIHDTASTTNIRRRGANTWLPISHIFQWVPRRFLPLAEQALNPRHTLQGDLQTVVCSIAQASESELRISPKIQVWAPRFVVRSSKPWRSTLARFLCEWCRHSYYLEQFLPICRRAGRD